MIFISFDVCIVSNLYVHSLLINLTPTCVGSLLHVYAIVLRYGYISDVVTTDRFIHKLPVRL